MNAHHVVASVLLVAVGFGAGAFWSARRTANSPEPHVVNAVRYHCPMHPAYTSDSPGTCPICGMTLVPIGNGPQVPPGTAAGASADVVDTGSLPPGTVYISPEKQQLVGVTYGVVESTTDGQGFRAVGNVAVDETRVVKVHPRFEGWIDKVFADYTGKLVTAGAPLLTVYSPELLGGQQEYLLALRNRERFSTAGGAGASGDSLVAASRQRLRLWDLTDEQLDQVARTGEPIANVTLFAPVSGYVVARNAYPKQHVMPDAELFTIADLTRVWVMADVAEQDAPMVHVGMPVTVTVAAAGRTFTGRVNVIQPQIDPASRTLKARIEAANPGFALRPDMFVDLEFTLPGRERLTVPASAVVATGLRRVVFVDRGNGHLEPRPVETGAIVGDRVEIVRGLAKGERLVTSGTFLIDSESQLKAAITGMGTAAAPATAPAPAPAAPSAPAGGGHVHD